MDANVARAYLEAYKGSFRSLMRWHQLDAFWEKLKTAADDGWYVYAVGEEPPQVPLDRQHFNSFIDEVDVLLRREHDEDYCGIVYADNVEAPAYIKIFDPNNLGVSCGFSEAPPLPGWILSRIQPVELETALRPPNNRRRWWQKLFSKKQES